jgi:hypothetical protein
MRTILATMLVALVGAMPPAQGQSPPPADTAALTDLRIRVDRYLAERKQLEATLPALAASASPEALAAHHRSLARLIQKARLGARTGDILSNPVRDTIRRRLGDILKGPDGAQARRAILDEFTGTFRVAINGDYPENAPVSFMPPRVLESLPKLPTPLEYRFIGKRLILLDTDARLVLDIVERAVS